MADRRCPGRGSRITARVAASDVVRRTVACLRTRVASDTGSASLEFITGGVLLLVPLVYLVLVLSAVQSAALGVDGAARQASRVYALAADPVSARAAAARAVEVTLADYGLDPAAAAVEISCRPEPRDCLARRGYVTVGVRVTVPLPLTPPALPVQVPVGVPVHAAATEQVSRFPTTAAP